MAYWGTLQNVGLSCDQGAKSGQEAPKGAMDRDALEVVIMHAVQASMTSAFAGLATDVQQLDAKFGAWSQRSEDVCTGIQRELIQLRRGTADDINAIGARLELLEARKVHSPMHSLLPAALGCTSIPQLMQKMSRTGHV